MSALLVTVRVNGIERTFSGRRALIIRELFEERLHLDDLEYGKVIVNLSPAEVRFVVERHYPAMKA